MPKLTSELFKTVVANAPLISIDLIVQDPMERVLLGKRLNRPAQGYWFVPGGRILKDETLASAFERLVKEELGLKRAICEAQFLGPFEHMYCDNFSGDGFSTHYVVLGYRLQLDVDLGKLPKEQHGTYEWFDVSELLTSDLVHDNTKLYFQ